MHHNISGKRVAILVANGFEQSEFAEPLRAIKEAGATPVVVSPEKDQVRGWKHTDWGDTYPVDMALDNARADEFDALVLPGGVMNPDQLRTDPRVQQFVRAFFDSQKPVAAICHGPWTLIDAGVAKGRTMTSYHTIRTDLENAGVHWLDKEVVVDHGLVTSRNPNDLPAFIDKMLEEISEGQHAAQHA